jgi:hypothetical protein
MLVTSRRKESSTAWDILEWYPEVGGLLDQKEVVGCKL